MDPAAPSPAPAQRRRTLRRSSSDSSLWELQANLNVTVTPLFRFHGERYRTARHNRVPDAVLSLPETNAADARQAECAVCLEDFMADDKLRTMPCSHCFHDRCLSEWLRISRSCPLCRLAIPK
ncbi:hypothetical protein GUJ93_ZPchr0012g19051 [Zizania palustris]|uniref:RING-type domain-containing protein n=1 Tax=Zizania palustris TaxID=103762 RepID=A0A8J6BRZ0_ZIZPA|nr:hypothetical protein GUJ93_ZPchr0012g19051 [Zizania palustris]